MAITASLLPAPLSLEQRLAVLEGRDRDLVAAWNAARATGNHATAMFLSDRLDESEERIETARWALRWKKPRACAEPGELTAVMEELFPVEVQRLADEYDRQMAERERIVLWDDGPRDEEAA